MMYSERLKHRDGLIDAPNGKTIPDYQKREEFYKAYQALCEAHGYELLPTYEGEPSAHDALIVVNHVNKCHEAFIVPWYDENGDEDSWTRE